MDALLQGRLGLRLPCHWYRGAVIEALYTEKLGGAGRDRTYGVSYVTDLQSAAFATRHTSPD